MSRRSPPSWALPAMALVYAGMLLGVSFIAVPAKFLARSIDLPQALDVGRQTFRVFGWVEVTCASALVAFSLMHARGIARWLAAAVMAVVGVQALVLRPPLDRRVESIMQGAELATSHFHNVYGALELCKLAFLVTIAWVCRPQQPPGSVTLQAR